MAKLPNRLVIEITNTDKVDELGNTVIDFESRDYAECVIEELEKIKAEITEYRSKHNCGVVECLDFIDKEIKTAKCESYKCVNQSNRNCKVGKWIFQFTKDTGRS